MDWLLLGAGLATRHVPRKLVRLQASTRSWAEARPCGYVSWSKKHRCAFWFIKGLLQPNVAQFVSAGMSWVQSGSLFWQWYIQGSQPSATSCQNTGASQVISPSSWNLNKISWERGKCGCLQCFYWLWLDSGASVTSLIVTVSRMEMWKVWTEALLCLLNEFPRPVSHGKY